MSKEQFFGDPNHIFVIAEAGSNWKCGSFDDDLEQAKKLIDVAVDSGADAVKFQTYKPETTYVSDAGNSTYLSEQGLNTNINEIFENLSMPYEMIPKLAKYCKEKKILFMSTPFSVEDAKAIDPYVEIHKIASFEINHIRLLEFLAKTRKPIILSTGASTFTEIDFAVNLLKKTGTSGIGLLQCTSKYPCPINALNLSVISKIKTRYNIPVGLSDHSLDPILAPTLSVKMGGTIIEKHFTIDRNLPGPDHSFALIPKELKLMVKEIRKKELKLNKEHQYTKNEKLALGSGKKEILPVETELRNFATRALQSIKNVKKGEILKEGINFDVLRPGNRSRGLEARFLLSVNGKKATKDIQKGDGITDFK